MSTATDSTKSNHAAVPAGRQHSASRNRTIVQIRLLACKTEPQTCRHDSRTASLLRYGVLSRRSIPILFLCHCRCSFYSSSIPASAAASQRIKPSSVILSHSAICSGVGFAHAPLRHNPRNGQRCTKSRGQRTAHRQGNHSA